MYFLDNKFRRTNLGFCWQRKKDWARGRLFSKTLKTSVPHILWKFWHQVTQVRSRGLRKRFLGFFYIIFYFKRFLLDLNWWPDLSWPGLKKYKMLSKNLLRAIPKTAALCPPFFRYHQRTWVGPTEFVVKNMTIIEEREIIICEKGKMGEVGSDLPSTHDYGNTYLPHAMPGHCVGLPALSLLSLMGSSLFSSPEFH